MEEQVGEIWHKFLDRVNDQSYPEASVKLKEIKPRLLIYFKALTKDNALNIELADKRLHFTQRNWLQKVAGSNRFIIACWRDADTLYLPAEISCFEDPELNKDCYFWLAGMSALVPAKALKVDNWLQYNQQLCHNTLNTFNGLRALYKKLVSAHISHRPTIDSLNKQDAQTELSIRKALLHPEKIQQLAETKHQPAHVPLWLYQPPTGHNKSIKRDDDNNNRHTKQHKEVKEMARKKAREVESTEETTGLITVRMENIFAWGEHAAVDRSMDDEEDLDNAEDAARDMDEIAVTHNQRAAASCLKFDLDLPSASVDDIVINNGIMLPEWNYKKAQLIENHCRIIELETQNLASTVLPDHLKTIAKKLKNQFQALAPARQWHSAQQDGQEIDIDRWIRYTSDKHAGHASADQLFKNMLSGSRDMCCTLLADLSLSTDTWLNNNDRIIDVIRDTLLLFGESLQATGDEFSMCGFSSRKRDPIRIHKLKGFNEKYNGLTRGRINAIKPGYYTRLGAAIRYTTQQLVKQPQSNRLLLILTDGKPNDLDQYEGRYGIEDTRQAILEARRDGLQPFCVTIDSKGNEYLPYLFGSNSYVIIKNPTELPKRLPLLYAQLTQQ
jgi:nitric oxide reductase NorD protein